MLLITVDSSMGVIGAGKSWMTEKLASMMPNSTAFIETIDVRWLEPMYDDFKNNIKPSPAATMFQIWQLGRRHRICQRAIHNAWDLGRISIVDRYLPSDGAFASCMHEDGLINDLNYEAYLQEWHGIENYVFPPHIVIDLRVTPETCLERILYRQGEDADRDSEDAITPEYLHRLGKHFDKLVMPWYKKRGSKIITVDWEEFKSIDNIMERIYAEVPILKTICEPNKYEVVTV